MRIYSFFYRSIEEKNRQGLTSDLPTGVVLVIAFLVMVLVLSSLVLVILLLKLLHVPLCY